MWDSRNSGSQMGDLNKVLRAPNSQEPILLQPEGYDDVSARRTRPNLEAPLKSWWK